MAILTRSMFAGAAAVGLALSLTACGNPLNMAKEAAVEKVIETTTGTEVDIGVESSASLPSSWPDIPTPKSAPMMSISTDDGYMATFPSSKAEVESIFKQMEASGFSEEASMDYGDAGKMVMYSGNDMGVAIMYGNDGEDYMVSYTVTFED